MQRYWRCSSLFAYGAGMIATGPRRRRWFRSSNSCRNEKETSVPPRICVRPGLFATLIVALSVTQAVAQEHQHPAAASPRQTPPITPTAKKLNESYRSNCEQFAVGFESPGRELFDGRVDV